MERLNWIHLSDWHIKSDDKWDQDIIIGALLKDLSNLKKTIDKFHFIFITGDMAYSAKTQEYSLVNKYLKEILKITNVKRDQVIMVPGNHDVNRQRITREQDSERFKVKTSGEINNIIQDTKKFNAYLKRFDNYSIFLSDFYKKKTKINKSSYFTILKKEIEQVNIGIIGLNSVWCSYGRNDDLNNLFLSEIQVFSALDKIEDCDLKIALVHHPLNWIHEGERRSIENKLYNQCDFILHGHKHESNIIELRSADGDVIIIPAGALYLGRDIYWTNSYNVVSLFITKGTGQIHFRRYSERRKEFIKDIDVTGDEDYGVKKITLNDSIYSKFLSLKSSDIEDTIIAKDIEFENYNKTQIEYAQCVVFNLVTENLDIRFGLLSFKARINYPNEAGSTNILRMELNEKILDETYCINRQGSYKINDGRILKYFDENKNSWRILYSPSFSENYQHPNYKVLDGDPYQFEFIVKDLLLIGSNELKLYHTGDSSSQAYQNPIIIEDFIIK